MLKARLGGKSGDEMLGVNPDVCNIVLDMTRRETYGSGMHNNSLRNFKQAE
jgi:hypothetical protein